MINLDIQLLKADLVKAGQERAMAQQINRSDTLHQVSAKLATIKNDFEFFGSIYRPEFFPDGLPVVCYNGANPDISKAIMGIPESVDLARLTDARFFHALICLKQKHGAPVAVSSTYFFVLSRIIDRLNNALAYEIDDPCVIFELWDLGDDYFADHVARQILRRARLNRELSMIKDGHAFYQIFNQQ